VDRETDEFVTLLTQSQQSLYACILSLLPDRAAANDLLQETNLTLWHKAEDFEPGTNFLAWATRIARYHVLNYRRKRQRDRLVFDEALFAELCDRQAARVEEAAPFAELLRECLKKLPDEHRELVEARYASGGSVRQIAESRGISPGAVSQTLYRIREALLNCISGRLRGVTQ
jgi:RNA polymerase sigma-70 factor (ECF subfamily)